MAESDCEYERCMDLALSQARLAADEGCVPVGAVIVRDGQAIAAAHNRRPQSFSFSHRQISYHSRHHLSRPF